jgi:hypothetical protein
VSDRSTRREVRNPLLSLPGFAAVDKLDPASRAALKGLALSLRDDARSRAEKSWRTHKAPMAVYWKAVAVYAGHLARAIR